MSENLRSRHELKFICSEAQLAVIRSLLQSVTSLDPHTADGQYTVRSMYFDTYDNRCYFENESGTDPREKYRIRIYNASDHRILLERKCKERGKTFKDSCQLSMTDFEQLVNGGRIADLSQKPPLLRSFMIRKKSELFRPAVIVEYERTPYVYRIGNVRITLDRNIRSSSDFHSFFQERISTRQIMPIGHHLLEVKFDEFLPAHIRQALQIENLSQSTFSKYYLCRKYSMGGLL